MPTLLMHFQSETQAETPAAEANGDNRQVISVLARRTAGTRQSQRDVCAHRATWACVCVLGAHMKVSHRNTGARSLKPNTKQPP